VINYNGLKPGKHQADAEELALIKANCVVASRRGKKLHLNTPRELQLTVS